MKHRRLTQEELLSELTERFGSNPMMFAFQCPNCADVATIQEFRDLDVDPGRAGQECIGRHAEGRGCDFAAYGLIPGPWEIALPDSDRPLRAFPIAPAPGGEPS